MFLKVGLIVVSLLLILAQGEDLRFTYNGFQSANLSLDGIAELTPSGLLKLTNGSKQEKGHAFYPFPVPFKNSSNASAAFSFSTTFVFGIVSEFLTLSGHGIAFVIAPTKGLPGALPSQYLGLFNESDNGNSSNHVIAVEFDTIQSSEFGDINDNHVGVDVNGMKSLEAKSAGYYTNKSEFLNMSLISGQPMQVWVEYDGVEKQINVTIAPIEIVKPDFPLLSLSLDLSQIVLENMYVGFSSSTGSVVTSHYVLGWSFRMNGEAQELNLSQLPKLPKIKGHHNYRNLIIGLLSSILIMFAAISGVVFVLKRNRKFAEELEDWELDYGPHRFKYKDLYVATKGFRDKELLGSGGFGRVYRGVLPTSKIEIAVKRVSHESRQGMREFIAEIVSIGRLRHRNLVTLLGYCRRKGELLLVYDYMPNGSLDKYIHGQPRVTLTWGQRLGVIKGVAKGLFYLHEEWEQIVIHRDIKASNVLVDGEWNGRLGDFGLSRLYDHGTDPVTTHVVGTLGYLAPEHSRTGKATTSTDVFAFGAFLLEVACGKRPIELQAAPMDDIILVDWVFSCWSRGELLVVCDPKLGGDYVREEMELVLKLGLMCSHSEPSARPSMRQVVQYLDRDIPLPTLSMLALSSAGLTYQLREGFDDFAMSCPSSMDKAFSQSSSVTESLLSGGR
ncbi:L-type lectin-domain containing receptor kinase IV.2-like [Malania oleifera]|uniref:L-type lectin-domain containing receptor kinase IV.2-like n=1 Tax=Malania oleifera TaxID=397392 RepID=UPI0025ADE252|nr:L-type lectin-domain containing receptor kinase IV.2-like [Malania oleifera]